MIRGLKRRVGQIESATLSEDIWEAIQVIIAGGEPPATRAGERAIAIWRRSEGVSPAYPFMRELCCRLHATGETLTDLVREVHERRLAATSKE